MRVSLIRLETVSGVTKCELKSGLCHWDFCKQWLPFSYRKLCSWFRPMTLKGSNNNNPGRNPGIGAPPPNPRTTEWFNSIALPSWEEYILISLTLFRADGWAKNGRLRKVGHCTPHCFHHPLFPPPKTGGGKIELVFLHWKLDW